MRFRDWFHRYTSIYLDGDYVNVYFVDIRHVIDYLDINYKSIKGYEDYDKFSAQAMKSDKIGPLSIMDRKKQYSADKVKKLKSPIIIRNTLQFIRIPSNLFNCDKNASILTNFSTAILDFVFCV